MRKLAPTLVLFALGLLAIAFPASAAGTMPVLPGINSPDTQPKGCVACHIATASATSV